MIFMICKQIPKNIDILGGYVWYVCKFNYSDRQQVQYQKAGEWGASF